MFCEDAHILRASSDTVMACISKRPAIARIACGSVRKRAGIFSVSLLLNRLDLLLCWKAMARRLRGRPTAEPKTKEAPPFPQLPVATGRSNTVKQAPNLNRDVRTAHTVPGA